MSRRLQLASCLFKTLSYSWMSWAEPNGSLNAGAPLTPREGPKDKRPHARITRHTMLLKLTRDVVCMLRWAVNHRLFHGSVFLFFFTSKYVGFLFYCYVKHNCKERQLVGFLQHFHHGWCCTTRFLSCTNYYWLICRTWESLSLAVIEGKLWSIGRIY